MASEDSITFSVHEVAPAKKRLPKVGLKKLFQSFCDNPEERLKILAVEKITARNFVKTDEDDLSISNGFVGACVSAWNDHYNLELSPDFVWIAIAQGLAAHINANAKKLRKAFVDHKGKKDIGLDNSRGQYGDFSKADCKWQDVIRNFSEAIGQQTKQNVRELVECDFSTTGLVELTVSQLALMDAMQPYFNYHGCVCGIPKITLTGTVEDWKKVRAKAAALAAYDLDWWLQELLPVLDHFVTAREGRPDVSFWRRICRQDGGTIIGHAYNKIPEYISGWLSVFFPYDSENKRRDLRWDAPKLEPWPPGSEAEDPDASNDQSAEYGLRIYNDDLPSGMSSAPVDISSPGGTLRMRLLGGFVGVEQDPKTLTLRPALSWCATECVKKARKSGNTGRRQRRKLS